MQNRLTIRDIARLNGVGEPTIPRVLNDESGVSQCMCEHVEIVMNQHGFSPSRPVCVMCGQSDRVVAIIVTHLDSSSEDLAIQAMLPAFYEQSYDPIMTKSQFFPQSVAEHLGVLKWRSIDGVVLSGFTGTIEEMLTHWQSLLVLPVRDVKGSAPVYYDDEGAIKILMQRLYDQGHRNTSYLGVPHSDVATGKRCHETYLAFCKAHELYPVIVLPGLVMEQGYENVARVITPETTVLLCATDTLALGASEYL